MSLNARAHSTKPEFLIELERTMALLAFDHIQTCPVSDLFEASQRQKTASELNAAILSAQSQDKDPKLPSLLKMLTWAQVRNMSKITEFVGGKSQFPKDSKSGVSTIGGRAFVKMLNKLWDLADVYTNAYESFLTMEWVLLS